MSLDVGYSQYALTKANQFVTVCFKNAGSDVIDLTSIKVVGYTGATTDKVSIQVIDAYGNTVKDGEGYSKTYYWRDGGDGAVGYWVRQKGRNIITINQGEVTFAVGDSLWCQKYADGLSFQFSGEVIQEKTAVSLTAANQAIGNMMATTVDLTALTVEGYTGATTDKVSIQIIDAYGNTVKDGEGYSKTYYWRDAGDGTGGYWVRQKGRSIITINQGDVVFNPGDGIWVQNYDTSTGYKLVFPAPSL